MTTDTQPRSLTQDVLAVYDTWTAQVIVYICVFAISLGVALFLDLRLGIPSGRVLAYVLPFTAAALILIPATFFALRSSPRIQAFFRFIRVLRDGSETASDLKVSLQTERQILPRVLIIEDDPRVKGLLVNAVSDKCEWVQAESAEKALVALTGSHFDSVIIDIEMDGVSEADLIRSVKSIAPDSLVLVIAGQTNIEAAIGAIPWLFFMRKQIDVSDFEANVKRALKRSALLPGKRTYEEHLG